MATVLNDSKNTVGEKNVFIRVRRYFCCSRSEQLPRRAGSPFDNAEFPL